MSLIDQEVLYPLLMVKAAQPQFTINATASSLCGPLVPCLMVRASRFVVHHHLLLPVLLALSHGLS